jgi:murein DD-endopeptidase MepM/ murein hydrolase activator NlpD
MRYAVILTLFIGLSAPGQNAGDMVSPIQGMQPQDIHDTFNEIHSGHKHEATDIMEPRGTPVHAVVDGVIQKLFLSKPGGTTIYEFDHSAEFCYYYAHLDHYGEGLHEGQILKRGDVIGYVGSTGNADPNAPHLHFAIFRLGPEKHWWQGTSVDPYSILVQLAQRNVHTIH